MSGGSCSPWLFSSHRLLVGEGPVWATRHHGARPGVMTYPIQRCAAFTVASRRSGRSPSRSAARLSGSRMPVYLPVWQCAAAVYNWCLRAVQICGRLADTNATSACGEQRAEEGQWLRLGVGGMTYRLLDRVSTPHASHAAVHPYGAPHPPKPRAARSGAHPVLRTLRESSYGERGHGRAVRVW